MAEPDFSESQFQEAVNTAFVRYIAESKGVWVLPNIVSLWDEFFLGWDTAFHFPWNGYKPLEEQSGCNFFIQYKLSTLLTSSGSSQWTDWNEPYFRFKIPHSTQNASGAFIDDYHQWDRLKNLAHKGYPTFYASNATLRKQALEASFSAGTLLDDIALMDVRDVKTKHKHVTFTADSGHFCMHSELERGERRSFRGELHKMDGGREATLADADRSLINDLEDVEAVDEHWYTDLRRLTRSGDGPTFTPEGVHRRHALLRAFVRKHFGCDLLWYPMEG